MEDLTLTGGKNISKFQSSEKELAEIAIKDLAKFHA
jgi:hypothetical protein